MRALELEHSNKMSNFLSSQFTLDSILGYLDASDIARLSSSCASLRYVITTDHELWARLFIVKFARPMTRGPFDERLTPYQLFCRRGLRQAYKGTAGGPLELDVETVVSSVDRDGGRVDAGFFETPEQVAALEPHPLGALRFVHLTRHRVAIAASDQGHLAAWTLPSALPPSPPPHAAGSRPTKLPPTQRSSVQADVFAHAIGAKARRDAKRKYAPVKRGTQEDKLLFFKIQARNQAAAAARAGGLPGAAATASASAGAELDLWGEPLLDEAGAHPAIGLSAQLPSSFSAEASGKPSRRSSESSVGHSDATHTGERASFRSIKATSGAVDRAAASALQDGGDSLRADRRHTATGLSDTGSVHSYASYGVSASDDEGMVDSALPSVAAAASRHASVASSLSSDDQQQAMGEAGSSSETTGAEAWILDEWDSRERDARADRGGKGRRGKMHASGRSSSDARSPPVHSGAGSPVGDEAAGEGRDSDLGEAASAGKSASKSRPKGRDAWSEADRAKWEAKQARWQERMDAKLAAKAAAGSARAAALLGSPESVGKPMQAGSGRSRISSLGSTSDVSESGGPTGVAMEPALSSPLQPVAASRRRSSGGIRQLTFDGGSASAGNGVPSLDELQAALLGAAGGSASVFLEGTPSKHSAVDADISLPVDIGGIHFAERPVGKQSSTLRVRSDSTASKATTATTEGEEDDSADEDEGIGVNAAEGGASLEAEALAGGSCETKPAALRGNSKKAQRARELQEKRAAKEAMKEAKRRRREEKAQVLERKKIDSAKALPQSSPPVLPQQAPKSPRTTASKPGFLPTSPPATAAKTHRASIGGGSVGAAAISSAGSSRPASSSSPKAASAAADGGSPKLKGSPASPPQPQQGRPPRSPAGGPLPSQAGPSFTPLVMAGKPKGTKLRSDIWFAAQWVRQEAPILCRTALRLPSGRPAQRRAVDSSYGTDLHMVGSGQAVTYHAVVAFADGTLGVLTPQSISPKLHDAVAVGPATTSTASDATAGIGGAAGASACSISSPELIATVGLTSPT